MAEASDEKVSNYTKDKVKMFEKVEQNNRPEDMIKQRSKAKFNARFFKFENNADMAPPKPQKSMAFIGRAKTFSSDTSSQGEEEKREKEMKERKEQFEKRKGSFMSLEKNPDLDIATANQNEEERLQEEQEKIRMEEEEKQKKKEEFKAKTKMFQSS